MANQIKWLPGKSSRGCNYKYCEGKHVNLTKLKNDFPDHSYLKKKNIPKYPEYVFRVSNVCHVTDKSGLEGIFRDDGFRGNDGLLWWGLSVTDGDIAEAEKNMLVPFPRENSSPAFQKKSLYGNFRFTFPLRKLLNLYSMQCCNNTAPVLRVLGTQVHKQEIVYSVLVHPKKLKADYRKYPRLPFNDKLVCGYKKGRMFWRCQSPSDKYYECDDRSPERPEYFVWDNVCMAFHMNPDDILHVDQGCLSDSLSVCKVALKKLLREPNMSVREAEEIVQLL
ncbi:uncharacterized protein LOC128514409 [Clarias gariepinus]|uniref:uncharacterized protein LOC128514409 n=1 Tax=Clarias gariepinus TaxID=13013 RepID=UPI00234DB4CF|nr:uncharacterized protein LOC128514409 [Clarias gariepinus]